MPAEKADADHHKAHYEKFTQHERELGSIKGDVGVLRTNVEALNRGQLAMQDSMTAGFKSVNESIESKSNQPAKIGVGLMATFITVVLALGVAGVSALWLTITLLVEPLDDDLSEVDFTLHELNQQRIEDAYLHGQNKVEHKWLRDDTEALKTDLHRHEDIPQHSQHNTH